MAEILFLSHTARSSTFRVGSHHLSVALAAAGHKVAHVSTPYSMMHRVLRPGQSDRRRAADRGVTEHGGVVDLIPRPILPANVTWSAGQMRRVLSTVGLSAPEFVFVDQPFFPAVGLSDATIIFRPTDVFPAGSAQRAADRAASESHGIAATSPYVLDSLSVPSGRPTRVIENGVEFSRFMEAQGEPKQVDFVYVGSLDARFDFNALAAAALRLPQRSFAIYGPVPASCPTMPANVELKGSLPYEEVPRALARGRVGIMPFASDRSNRGRSPMKLYEYIAAGLPVVAPSEIAERAPELSGLVGFDSREPSGLADALTRKAGDLRVTASDLDVARSKDWSRISLTLLEFATDLQGRTRNRVDA